MADLRRKISHLINMADRYDLSTPEGRLISEMMDVVRSMAMDVEEVGMNQVELEQYVEEIDSDLMTLEEDVYSDEVDDDDDDNDDYEFEESSADDSYLELECPTCHYASMYDEDLFDEDGVQLSCPHCGNVVFDADEDYLIIDDDDEGYARNQYQ